MFRAQKVIQVVLILAGAGFLIFVIWFYYQNLRGIGPALEKPPADVTQVIQNDSGFKMPAGFSLSVLAKDLPGVRVMIFDKDNNLWLSQTRQGKITKITLKNGQVAEQKTILSGLQNPHGLAFDPENPNILYLAEETKISKTEITPVGAGPLQKIIDLPKGGNHFTRTLGFGPDGRLYVSIGSTCNVCRETDPRYASIWSLKKDGSDFKQLAKGLRNSVFFIWNQKDGKMWATEMGRDLLGDDIPPDEVNIIDTQSPTVLNYGWPVCYGGKNIHDTKFDKNTYIRNPCQAPFELPSQIDLPAHSAPLGLAFVPASSAGRPANSVWPKEYQNNLIVAFHGSWNRSVPTGYKLVRLILDNNGNEIVQEDFITGWLTPQGAIGRPVDVIFDTAGNLYVSDDKAGVIYKVEYKK